MRRPITMPKLGYDSEVGRIASWLKQVGDPVSRGEAVAEIETEKVTIEMEAYDSGTLIEIVHTAGTGEEVPVGEVIAYIEVRD